MTMYTKYFEGIIEVITGPMFSGKSEELIRRVRVLSYSKKRTLVFQPKIGIRWGSSNLKSRSGNEIEAKVIEHSKDILKILTLDYGVIAIDEAQFFDVGLIDVVQELANKGFKVIVSGLDKDYRGKTFGPMGDILAIADVVTKLIAICIECGYAGTQTFKKIKNKETIMVGDKEYEALCRKCWLIKSK